jgi:hypothetical protein
VKLYLICLIVLFSFFPVVFSQTVIAEPYLEITDCVQSHHYLTFTTNAFGFMPNTRILVFYYLPESDRGWGSSSLTDSSGNWEKHEGHLSSADIPYGIWKVEAYNVDENQNRLPDSPYATTEFETPCPFPTAPPDTDVYATVNGEQILSGDSVTSNSINFTYYIRDSFSSFAKFDCKLDVGQYEDCTTIKCENPNSCSLNPRGTVMDGYSEKGYDNLSIGDHEFMVRATDDSDNMDPTPAEFIWTILGPIADAGPDQSVKSDELVQLDGSNSSDPEGSALTYYWNHTDGQDVVLNDATSVNPTFTAPETTTQTSITFQLTVTNEEGITSEPDKVVVTVSPVFAPPPSEDPQTIRDIIIDLIQNPLDITNSIESSNKIIEILTDGNSDNDQLVCELLGGIQNKDVHNMREIINC